MSSQVLLICVFIVYNFNSFYHFSLNVLYFNVGRFKYFNVDNFLYFLLICLHVFELFLFYLLFLSCIRWHTLDAYSKWLVIKLLYNIWHVTLSILSFFISSMQFAILILKLIWVLNSKLLSVIYSQIRSTIYTL